MVKDLGNKHSRRNILLGAAAMCGGTLAQKAFGRLACSFADHREESATWKLRLSASSINFSSLPIEEACKRIAALGFEAIDIWSAHAGCPHLDDVQNRLKAEGLLRLLEECRLKLYSFSVYQGGYLRYAELLGQCGGGVAIRGSTSPCEPKELIPKMKAFLESLKPELEKAEAYNSYLAIENHGHALIDSCDSLKAFVDLNIHPRLGIALAPYHIHGRNESVEAAIHICGQQLFYFYAWQHGSGLNQLPGYGGTDFTPWLKALSQISYKWYINPFMHHEPTPDEMSVALANSRKYLIRCAEGFANNP
ncbi:MAG: sugar phosphate isomerase/epimerase family protein [Thermogutta sp.]